MPSLNSNIFAIGRTRGDENQLTALLGALFRREPRALERFLSKMGLDWFDDASWTVDVELAHSRGRFDLVLSSPRAVVVVESKIHAGLATTQVRRYLERLADHAGPLRALIVLAPKKMELPDQDQHYADTHGITLCAARWQTLAECLDDPDTATLAGDFAELLMSEGLAATPGMTADDWQVLHGAPQTFARLVRLVGAASERLIASGVMTSSTPARASGERRVMATLSHGSRELRIGVAASDGSRRPDTPPMAWVGLSDTSVPKDDRQRWAEWRAGTLGAEADGSWVVRKQPAAALLRGSSFEEQAAALAWFAVDFLEADTGASA